MVEINNQILSEDEAALYDRQIRLWGLDAQKRLRAANVLVAGACGLGAEVIKNIVLSGIKSLKILDHREVSILDTYANFLVPHDSVGKNIAEASLERTQILNPMVDVTSDSQDVATLDEEYFKQFDIICLCRSTKEQITRINNVCHQLKVQFFAGDVYGMHGFFFVDLIDHSYVEEVKEKVETGEGDHKQISEETKLVKQKESFVPFSVTLDTDWTLQKNVNRLKRTTSSLFLLQVLQEFELLHKRRPTPVNRLADENELLTIKHALFDKLGIPQDKLHNSFVENIFGQISPSCAIVGGVLAQEIIKAVSQKDQPLNNYFFFNPQDGAGVIESLGY